jgi:serine/threonine protein kinase
VVATVSELLVGQLLDGRYRIVARIARGGMATVYEALDTRLHREVAVKVMHASLARDPDFVDRFIREARSAARLSHPNVVAVFDQGSQPDPRTGEDCVYLVMELIRGRTLRQLLRERGPLPAADALAVIEPVLAALRAAHDAGIIHRDVKPENVLLADDGRVEVADFGLARAVNSASGHTMTRGVLLGTVSYLAPEQVVDGSADARTDVYAAGIVLFEMLTGTKPHEGDSPIAVAYKHVNDDVPRPSALPSTTCSGAR